MFLILSPASAQETCFPVSHLVDRMVRGSVIGDEAAVFVEEASRCEDGLPAVEPPQVPAGLHGRPAIEWLLDALRVDGQRTHELWSRGDAWLVAPRTGAVALDTVVAVDASRTPDLQAAFASLSPQVGNAVGAVIVVPLMEHPGGDVPRPNTVTMRGGLLEVLRALDRQHENPDAKFGWGFRPGQTIWPMADTAGASTRAEPPMPSFVLMEGDVHPMRTAKGDIIAVLGWDRVQPTWTEADDVIQVSEEGDQYFVESALVNPPKPRPPPSVWPPPYPFPVGQ